MSYTLTAGNAILLGLLIVWELIWKGLAMWRAAKFNQAYWFGALLIINSAGILPIAYLLLTNRGKESGVKNGN